VSLSAASTSSPCRGLTLTSVTVTAACSLIPSLGKYARLEALNPTACTLGAEPLFAVSPPFSNDNCTLPEVFGYSPVRLGACFDAQVLGSYPAAATFDAAAGTLSLTAFNKSPALSQLESIPLLECQ
jgi:hypothetical protein